MSSETFETSSKMFRLCRGLERKSRMWFEASEELKCRDLATCLCQSRATRNLRACVRLQEFHRRLQKALIELEKTKATATV